MKLFSRIPVIWKNSSIYRVFNTQTVDGRGRLCMQLVSIFGGIAGQLSGGFFYTGFLIGYDMNIVDIGIITYIPSICALLTFFSPMVLERFKKRKLVLALGRIAYYAINIVGITLLPNIVSGKEQRLAGFIIIIIVANSINAIFSPGYSAWQANFLPDEIRADYFTVSSCITSLFTYAIVYALSIVTDSLSGSPAQLTVIIIFRYIAFAIAILDVIMISLPKEYEYSHTREKSKLSDVFLIPLKNKPFALTMLLLFIYQVAASLPNATINTFLLADIGISYSLANGINAMYFLFFIVFGGLCRKFIRKVTWFRVFAWGVLYLGVTQVMYSFITVENASWLYVTVRLLQHVNGVFVNTAVAALPYVNLPENDRVSYFSFNSMRTSVGGFLGLITGTYFTKFFGDRLVTLFGHGFGATPVLLAVSGTIEILVCIAVLLLFKTLTPKYMADTYYADKRLRAQRRLMKKGN